MLRRICRWVGRYQTHLPLCMPLNDADQLIGAVSTYSKPLPNKVRPWQDSGTLVLVT